MENTIMLARIDEQTKSQEKQIDSLTTELKSFEHEIRLEIEKINEETRVLNSLAVSIENLSKNLKENSHKIDKLSDTQDELKEKIVNLEHKPADKALKFNEEIKNKIIIGIIIGAVGFICGFFLPFGI